jgi:hypothetical protein
MKVKFPGRMGCALLFPRSRKGIAAAILLALTAQVLVGKPVARPRLGIVSDWTHHHVLYPAAKNNSMTAGIPRDPRWLQSWYLHHQALLWPRRPPRPVRPFEGNRRDWSVSIGTTTFEPLFDFSFDIAPQTGYGSLNTTDEGNGQFLATVGNVTITAGNDLGTYPLYPGGPGVTVSPAGAFDYDDLLYSQSNPPLDVDGLLFTAPGLEINIWGNSANNYSFYDYSNGAYGTQLTEAGTFTLDAAPGGGQTYPAKYSFDVTAPPSCANDFAVIGIPANPASGGQANIVGFNNLYSAQGAPASPPDCTTNGPTVMFAYASGSGQVPDAITLSLSGSQIAYVENLTTGSSYFHVLTIGTTGTNGTSPTDAVLPGAAGGNNAVDQSVLLSPDGGITNQSSTNAPFVAYSANDANDVAYVTTYSRAGSGSGYLYKISNVFNGSAPTIVWSVAIDAVPSTPIYDGVSNQIFFTDSNGRIDYVTDTGMSPSVVYGPTLASGTTSEYPVTIDIINQMVYASFNSNGTDAIVIQAPVNLSSSVSVSVGTGSTLYAAPYGPAFNNAFYTGSGTPLMYVAGTGAGTVPTLYAVGFGAGGVLNPGSVSSAALATGMADSSPVTEFYNAQLGKDYLFVSVTNNCVATTAGGTAGCVMSFDITAGFPTINAGSTALPAAGGTSGIIVDNDSTGLSQASSIYFATKTGAALVKATQSGLN